MTNTTFEERTKAKMLAAGFEPKNKYHILVYGQLGEENYKTIRELIFKYLCQKADIMRKKSIMVLKDLDFEIDNAMQRVSLALSELEKKEIRLKGKKIPKLDESELFSKAMAQLFAQYNPSSDTSETAFSKTIDRLIA